MTGEHPNVVVSAFTEEQVERLTGLSRHQLRYWDRTRFYQPEFGDENRRDPYSRIYSFRDIVSLQILRALRNDLGVSLQHLREVKQKLAHLGEAKWSRTVLYVLKKKVVFHDQDADERREVVSGQIVLQIAIETVRANMEKAVRDMRKRDEGQVGKIARNRQVSHNAPVIGGTRIPVDAIKAFHADGHSIERILEEYPTLTRADVLVALDYGKAA
jgi:uncharacterized protein (DUF433 family)